MNGVFYVATVIFEDKDYVIGVFSNEFSAARALDSFSKISDGRIDGTIGKFPIDAIPVESLMTLWEQFRKPVATPQSSGRYPWDDIDLTNQGLPVTEEVTDEE